MARKPLVIIGVVIGVLVLSGCEVTFSVFLQKDWNTDPHTYKNNDLITKAEIKVSRLMGKDAKKAEMKK